MSQLQLFGSPVPPTIAWPAPAAPVVRPTQVSGELVGSELERLVEAFLLSAVDNLNTRRAYRANLAKAIGMFGARRIQQVTLGDLVAYRAAITNSALAPSSQTQAIFSLRGFLTWAADLVDLPFSIESARKVLLAAKSETVSPPAILTPAETAAVLAAAPADNGLRAMMFALLGGGLRISELCALDCTDVVVDPSGEGTLRVRGKGRRDRLVPVHAPVTEAISTYAMATGRRLEQPGPLFFAHHAAAAGRPPRRIGTRNTRRRVNRLMRQLGISKPVRVHGLRHTFSTEIIRAGGTAFHLQKLLGHRSIVTTQRYVDHLDLGELRESIPRCLVGG